MKLTEETKSGADTKKKDLAGKLGGGGPVGGNNSAEMEALRKQVAELKA